MAQILSTLDGWILWLLPALAVFLAVNGFDELFVDTAAVMMWWKRRARRTPSEAPSGPERRTAILLPLWHEDGVVAAMVAHNLAAIRYGNYDIFAGCYPNDEKTTEEVRGLEARHANVHLAMCPHDGPTSKADCLNWIYQHLLAYEDRSGAVFDLIMTHDAEDLIHPDSLKWVSYYIAEYDFIQVPVLALPTPALEFTHGIYCDEFAEFQTRDLPLRNTMGGFVPSAGVGTAYSRRALEALAVSEANRIFDPAALTEDYENGFRLHELGFRQLFLPPFRSGSAWMATREYFPRTWRAAVRQRTRWVTGIALQGWERHGWHSQLYWLWRDRKGLLGGPVSALTNLVTLYAAVTRMWDRVTPGRFTAALCAVTLGLQVMRSGVRMWCSARVYGWAFASLAPLRAVYANIIHAAATWGALRRFAIARLKKEPLVWLKTEHSYPNRVALVSERRRLGEILVASGYITAVDLDDALASRPDGVRIGEYLIRIGLLTEDQLYEALSLQQALPFGAGDSPAVTGLLPAAVIRTWNVLPFRVEDGRLLIATPEPPTEAMMIALREHTSLDVQVHLVTPSAYRDMSA